MKLFYVPHTCALSPSIVLREAGLSFEHCLVDRQTKKAKDGTDYLQINPLGYVPALQIDNGKVLTEGAAIIQYIADQVPEKNLAPRPGTWERHELQQMLNFIATEIHKGFSPLFNQKIEGEVRKAYVDRLSQRLGHLAQRLEKQPYLMGQAFTIADAYLFTVLGWAPWVKLDLSAWPSLQSFQARMAERPAVAAALKAEA